MPKTFSPVTLTLEIREILRRVPTQDLYGVLLERCDHILLAMEVAEDQVGACQRIYATKGNSPIRMNMARELLAHEENYKEACEEENPC